MSTPNNTHAGIAVALAMTMAIVPLALDTYLPALPIIANSLSISVHDAALTISIYVFVLAFGQLSGGPLSDRFGRRKVMMSGMLIFSSTSILLANASSLPEFLLLRAIQAFGGGWAVVVVPALVRDRLSGNEAAKFFSLIGLLMVLAPAAAPIIGSVIVTFSGWRSIFVFLAFYAILTLVLMRAVIFKHKVEAIIQDKTSTWRRYSDVMANRSAMGIMLIGSLSFSVLLLFLTHASFIYQHHFNVNPVKFSVLLSANVVLIIIINLCNRRLLNYFPAAQILCWSLTIQGVGLVVLLIISSVHPPLWLFATTMAITLGMQGAISPNIQSTYMDFFHKNSGTAAALKGATQFSVAGLISGISTLLPESLFYIILAQAACAVVYLTLIWRK